MWFFIGTKEPATRLCNVDDKILRGGIVARKNNREDGFAVYCAKFGILSPLNWDNDCHEHLYLQNKLWNTLVNVERKYSIEYERLKGKDAEYRELVNELRECREHKKNLSRQRNSLRVIHRKQKGDHVADLDADIAVVSRKIDELIESKGIRDAQLKAKTDITKDALDAINAVRLSEVTTARQESGLWWGNYNAVIDSYNSARSKCLQARSSGDSAELSYHRFDGSGRFTVQFQGGLLYEDFVAGRSQAAQLQLMSGDAFAEMLGNKRTTEQSCGSKRDSRQYGLLSITVYTFKDPDGKTQRKKLDLPIIIHRPIDPDSKLKLLTVTKRKIGSKFRWSVSLMYEAKAPDIPEEFTEDRPQCGINFGWKRVEGGLRVATVYDEEGVVSHKVLPQQIVDTINYCDGDLKSRIDLLTNDSYIWLAGELDREDLPESLQDIAGRLKRSRKPHPDKFSRWCWEWQRNCPEFCPEALTEAHRRRKLLKQDLLERSFLTKKIMGRRLDMYKCLAKELTETYSKITMDDLDLSTLSRLESKAGVPNALPKLARNLRTKASLYNLKMWIKLQAAKTGTEFEFVKIPSTKMCSICGGTMPDNHRIERVCDTCGAVADQDVNAAVNLYASGVVMDELKTDLKFVNVGNL